MNILGMRHLNLHDISAATAETRDTARQIKTPQTDETLIKTHGQYFIPFLIKTGQPVL